MAEETNDYVYELINKLFVYKAEWLDNDMFSLYTKPSYFPEITGVESCVLIGGRGTGKTTVLKGLSYEGENYLLGRTPDKWDYYGLYYKVESNRVSAFTGLGKSDEEWIRPFGHYVNLVVLSLVADLLIWLENKRFINSDDLSDVSWRIFESSLGCNKLNSFAEIKTFVYSELSRFENYINSNIRDEYNLSILGGPIDRLFEATRSLNFFNKKKFFILIDEYESFSEYQQKVVNTLIKQASGKNYCFKIGVRELGWKSRITLNNQELRSPSDYRKIDIQNELEKDFDQFAKTICEERISVLYKQLNIDTKPLVNNLFPSLSIEAEAELLGIKDIIKESNKYSEVASLLPEHHYLFIWLLCKWEHNINLSPQEIVKNFKNNSRQWTFRYGNYKYALLFAIKGNKVGFRKYYSGWSTLVIMAGANIRFLLQLVEYCLKMHIKDDGKIGQPVQAIIQTKAAHQVGFSNFEELEGLDVRGNYIMQMLQGLGRAFEILARQPFGHAPEINQFTLNDGEANDTPEDSYTINISSLLEASISHLAIRRSISTKLSSNDPKSYDYSIHPIYSALFQISHRKKRKLSLSKNNLTELITDQKSAIDKLLKQHNREESFSDEYLITSDKITGEGTQLNLF